MLTEGGTIYSALSLVLNKKLALISLRINSTIYYNVLFLTKSTSKVVDIRGLARPSYNLDREVSTTVKCRFIYI